VDIPTRTLEEVFAVCRFMSNFPGRWWLGGGWAIDAWFGIQSREHEDIEICVARQDQANIYAYCAGWQFFTPVNNDWAPLPGGEFLAAPRFMLQLQRPPDLIDPVEGMPPTFEFLLNEVDGDRWMLMRDPSIHLPLERVYWRSSWGMLVVMPEILLLHKAVYRPRPKDEHDFQRMLPQAKQRLKARPRKSRHMKEGHARFD
jgi:Aminoglycoside-2''-adenylyltransferase